MAAAPAILGMHLMSASPVWAQDYTQDNTQPDISTALSFTLDPRSPLDTNAGLIAGGVAGGLALAFTAMAYRRRVKVALPYGLAGGVVALAVLNPVMIKRDLENMPRDIAVVVDKTASNIVGGREKITEELSQYVRDQLKVLGHVNIRVIDMEDPSDDMMEPGSRLFDPS